MIKIIRYKIFNFMVFMHNAVTFFFVLVVLHRD